ncbi:hypothetical protein IW148_003089 [Coemansia sp. RSA 1199]|nr:hypothetical protein IW148_003089 [Coemansia sp. RSA 1199]
MDGWVTKRARACVSCAVRLLCAVDERWLDMSISLSMYSLVWRAFSWSLDAFDTDVSMLRGTSSWVIHGTNVTTYLGLLLLVFFPPVYFVQSIFLTLRAHPGQLIDHVFVCAQFVVAVLTTLSNFSGTIDLVLVPLVSDILLHVWHWCAVLSACVAVLALPLYITSDRPRMWHMLWLPCVVCSVSASDLSLVLQAQDASSLLSLGFVMWGASIIPSVCFAIGHIRRSLRSCELSVLIPPLAVVSQLALGVMALGVQSKRVWGGTVGPATAPLLLGELAMAAGAVLGLVLWAASAAWFVNAHVLVVWMQWRRRSTGWSISVCKAAYPVASFTMATIYVARVWSSRSALLCSQFLIAYLSFVLLVVPVARAIVGTARLFRRMCTPRINSNDRRLPTYGAIQSM